MWGQIGGDSENETPENGPHLSCPPDRGGHIRARVSKRGKNWSKENHQTPCLGWEWWQRLRKGGAGMWRMPWGQTSGEGATQLESVTECLNVIPNVLLPSVSSVQSFSRVLLFATPWTAASQASLSITGARSSPKLMSIESVMPSNYLILCRSLLLPPSIFPSSTSRWSRQHNLLPKNKDKGMKICLFGIKQICKGGFLQRKYVLYVLDLVWLVTESK